MGVGVQIAARLTVSGGKTIREGLLIHCDIIDSDAPLLISRVSMKNLSRSLDFDRNRLISTDGSSTQLKLQDNGHLAIPVINNAHWSDQNDIWILTTALGRNETNPDGMVDIESFRKLHLHFPHVSE